MMSNALAIGAVTAVMKNILENGLARPEAVSSLNDPQVGVLLPNIDPTGGNNKDRLNLFLYQTTLNTSWRNVGMPSRNSDGDRINNPPLALDLHYLITAFSRDAFHAEILLGVAMQILHETPVLPRDKIRSVLQALATTVPSLVGLASAGLEDQIDQVKITPQPMNIEEISKLWAAMQTQYQPTMAYQVSVVLIERNRSVKTAIPAQVLQLVALPYRSIVIDEILPKVITSGSVITLKGMNFNGDQVQVLVNGAIVPPSVISGGEIQLALPTTLPAGVTGVQVQHFADFGAVSGLRQSFESNVMPFVLRPKIETAAVTTPLTGGQAEVTLTITPAIEPNQKVILLMNQLGVEKAAGYSFMVAARNTPQTQITVSLSNVQAGRYLLRVQVDGAESLPAVGADNLYSGEPAVTL
jgi:hypothetical protein